MSQTDTLCMGMISGTSMDAVDCVLARFGNGQPETVATHSHRFPSDLRNRIREACRGPVPLAELARLDVELGHLFADAAEQLIELAQPHALTVIGSHGQTLLHQTDREPRHTVQLGNPNLIAQRTGCTVVADFRSADLAVGGEGAPLAPLLHDHLFRQRNRDRAVLNLGGIANLTLLPADGSVQGFDTGPANCLVDAWCLRHRGETFDAGGAWAATGQVQQDFLQRLLSHSYLERPPPKSTHTDVFDLAWLDEQIGNDRYPPEDVQATLLALTTTSIVRGLQQAAFEPEDLLVCGGGVYNGVLMQQLADALPRCRVESTARHGLDPDWVEATLFAWLARRRLQGLASDTSSITGASRAVMLGGIWQG